MTGFSFIFDVDGTLAETEELHRTAFNQTFADAGLNWFWTRDIYRRLLNVTGGKERIAAWGREIGYSLSPDEIVNLHAAKTRAYAALMAAGEISLRPGVQRMLDLAVMRGISRAIATTTSRANVDALSRAIWGCESLEIFTTIAAGDDVPCKKPAPDIYTLALSRLGIGPEHALAFEDSRNGLLSARAAGLRSVVTPSLYTAGDDFTGAWLVLPDLSGFDPVADVFCLAGTAS